MTRSIALCMILVLALFATISVAEEPPESEAQPSDSRARMTEADLVEGWTARPYGVKLSRFMSACDQGEKIGCNEAAWLLNTSGYSSDRPNAEKLVTSKGSCPYEIGFSACVQQGRLAPMQRACESGNAALCRKWGDAIGRVRTEDFAGMLIAYIRACTLGNGPACRTAAGLSEHNPSLPGADETSLTERGCDLGESTECWAIAQWHAKGSHGYERNHDKYKEVMKEVERLDKEGEKRWTQVRAGIQKDALERLGSARISWAATEAEQGPTYCIHHSTSRRGWVQGTIEGGVAKDWEGCKIEEGKRDCEAKRGSAPKTMEQMFDSCTKILNSSPAKFEFGFHARPDGALLSCYTHAEGCSENCGRSLSISKVVLGGCE